MAQTIAAPVGRLGGLNRPSDVKVVQELLNRVPHAAGGPYPLLAVDSLCGPKTMDAIQNFQLQQFGWGEADGRVDPNGPTLQKLNQLSGNPAPLQPKVLTAATRLYCPHGSSICVTVKGTHSLGPDGSPALRATDEFKVVGCPLPTPCSWVNWVIASDPLTVGSIGICMSAAGVPLGKVRVG